MDAPYFPSPSTCVREALPDQLLPRLRCHSVSWAMGIGIQAREMPCGRETSTRVVTSKVRQALSAAASRQGSDATAAVAMPDFRNALRSMVCSYWEVGDCGRG